MCLTPRLSFPLPPSLLLAHTRFVLCTKVGRYESGTDFSGKRVQESVDESLERLQLDHIDVIQCHDIEFATSIDMVRACVCVCVCAFVYACLQF